MEKMNSIDEAFCTYTDLHPTYNSVLFSSVADEANAKLHPLYVMSQYFIDSLLEQEKRRISIVLPDYDSNLITLVLAKYFQNLQEDPYYADSILDSIEPGQHVKLGKAVAEFLGIDREKNTIKYRISRPDKYGNSIVQTSPITNYHLLLEKTEAEVSSLKMWGKERTRIQQSIPAEGISLFLDKIIQKKTGVKKTIVVFAQKNELKDYMSDLYINDNSLEDILAYGELTEDEKCYSVFNKGRLDCLPGIAIANKLSQITNFASAMEPESIACIYCFPEKFQEILNNLDEFKKVLKLKAPVVIFVPEGEFEYYDVIRDLNFVLWQWKPTTLKSECFRYAYDYQQADNVFSRLAKKVDRAGKATCRVVRCESNGLADVKAVIQVLFKEIDEDDKNLKHVLIMLNRYHKIISSLCFIISPEMKKYLMKQLEAVDDYWKTIARVYDGTTVGERIEQILNYFIDRINVEQTNKATVISDTIKGNGRSCVVIPDDICELYEIISERRAIDYAVAGNYRVYSFSEFLSKCDSGFSVDKVIVPWFESSKYLKIKQTYSYNQLICVLYDFENKWRSAFIRRLDSSFSHEELKKTISKMNISNNEIANVPFDNVEIEIDSNNPFNDEYDFDRNIIRRAVGKSTASENLADSVECVPVILSGETVALWGLGHEVFDVTDICFEGSDKTEKITAEKLSPGHIVLIRQSGRNLITEKADQLMKHENRESLRKTASLWASTLANYAAGKTIQEVTDALASAGSLCTPQQVRYWIQGETIRPNDKEAIRSIAKISDDNYLMSNIDKVYIAGGDVQEYHRKAGRLLSKAIKNKAKEIQNIYFSGSMSGVLEGIGEIRLYVVEEVLSKEFVSRNKINSLEVYA